MSGEEPDLTGRWTGIYFYPAGGAWNANDDYPPTPFTAELVDDHGVVSGSTLEPDMFGLAIGNEIRATVEGHRSAGQLRFTKYPDTPRQSPIHYTGTISPGGNSISGQWVIPGDWSGTFRMQRKLAPAGAELETTTAARG